MCNGEWIFSATINCVIYILYLWNTFPRHLVREENVRSEFPRIAESLLDACSNNFICLNLL